MKVTVNALCQSEALKPLVSFIACTHTHTHTCGKVDCDTRGKNLVMVHNEVIEWQCEAELHYEWGVQCEAELHYEWGVQCEAELHYECTV